MPPPRAPTISMIGQLDTRPLLEALRQARSAAGILELQLKRRCVHRAALEAFRGEVDEVAGLITGDRTFFHGENTTPRPGSDRP